MAEVKASLYVRTELCACSCVFFLLELQEKCAAIELLAAA